MTIGLDIDDTMTNSSGVIIEHAMRYFKSNDVDLVKQKLRGPLEGDLYEFYYEFLPKMVTKYTLKENVVKVINKLKENGHEIIIITARGCTIKNGVVEASQKYLEKNNIIVDKVLFGHGNKVTTCLENNVDLMVDDSISVLNKCKESNINVLLFESDRNKDFDVDMDRVNSWNELEEYINNFN